MMEIMLEKDLSYYVAVVLSACGFALIYHYASPWISQKISRSYKNRFTDDTKSDWNIRVVSTIHALIVNILALYALFKDSYINKNDVWSDAVSPKIISAIFMGFIVVDLVVMIAHYSTQGAWYYFVHHFLGLYAAHYVITYGILPWVAIVRLLSEFSTPFVNIRWFLLATGRKNRKRFIANGVMLAATFFLVRVASIPIHWSGVYAIYRSSGFDQLGWIWPLLLIASVALDSLNCYWFYLIARGVHKTVCARAREEQKQG